MDDCNFNLVAVQSLLQQFRLKAEICHDGEMAVNKVKKRYASGNSMYELILMDYSMPILDGPGSTAQIKAFLEGKNVVRLPYICFLTAYTQKSFIDVAKAAGANDFLVKPIFKSQCH